MRRRDAHRLTAAQFNHLDKNRDRKLSTQELMDADRDETKMKNMIMETTAYSDDFASCGWEFGAALFDIPRSKSKKGYYISLSKGIRPSGTTAHRGHIKRRYDLDDGIDNRLLGMWLGAAVGLASGLGSYIWRKFKVIREGKEGKEHPQFKKSLTTGLALGAAVGLFNPVGRYWAETSCQGKAYYGTTSMLTKPTEPRPWIIHPSVLSKPKTLLYRLLTFKWRPMHGTIAADHEHFHYGTKFYIPGYGWGEVEDKGGAIMGDTRLDLFFKSRKEALQWGRKQVKCLMIHPEGGQPVKKIYPPAEEEVHHIVAPNESLWKIVALEYPQQMCSIEDVRLINNLSEDSVLSIGQRLLIPNCGGATE